MNRNDSAGGQGAEVCKPDSLQFLEPDMLLHDVREAPFELFGLYDAKNQPCFKRLPDEVAANVNPGVSRLYLDTAGGRVRFSTDSLYVAIFAKMPFVEQKSHVSLLGTTGFDLYLDYPDTPIISRFQGAFKPAPDITDGYESILRFPDRSMRSFTLNMPSFAHVDRLYIGLQKDAAVGGGKKYRNDLPVVFYGSSITQGACSSRPGMTYLNIVSRRLDIDYINLGFAGNAHGELPLASYMASMDMSMFVSDYDHNATDPEQLASSHCRLYQTIRAEHPDIPYVMLSRPDFDHNIESSIRRRNVIMDTYRFAREQGDRNVYYIDGQGIYLGREEDNCTVDGCHPNDCGFVKMADAVESVLLRAMRGSAPRGR